MTYSLSEIFGYSIALPAIISLFKLGRTDWRFLPFFLFVWLGITAEIISTLMINNRQSNALPMNLYVLLEAMLITWQFQRWKLFSRNPWFPWALMAAFTAFWIVENFILSSIHQFNSYFRIIYSFSIVLMSISTINQRFLNERKSIILNPIFLACLGFIIFFTYKVLVEIFWVYGLNGSREFRNAVYGIMTYINLFANLLYCLVILWIPKKQEYTLL
jgi:hypothetical protein